MQAIARWLNRNYGYGQQVAWAKQDNAHRCPLPDEIMNAWSEYARPFDKYGKVLRFVPPHYENATLAAVTALLDVMFEEQGHQPPQGSRGRTGSRSSHQWFSQIVERPPGRTLSLIAG